ncbi:MAG: class I SAM-dependent methyltransferase [Methylobacteriaceae bacterium]|nr:class I SAM-dependent methyltransferase [Methylobacteriaceae bacterium]
MARDPFLQQVVEEAIESRIPVGSTVLDIGCGDGRSTLRFARRAAAITGVDYIPAFVEKAAAAARAEGVGNVRFLQADATALTDRKAQIGAVDVAVSIRCLINLDSWDRQKAALRQIADMVKPGGLYLLSEGWDEGMEGLNALRSRAGLPPIVPVPYNLTISRKLFEKEIAGLFAVEEYVNLGFYIMMSRFVQPCAVYPEPPRHDHAINALAAALQRECRDSPLFGSADYAGVYVLRRLG